MASSGRWPDARRDGVDPRGVSPSGRRIVERDISGVRWVHELLLRRLRICSVILTGTSTALLARYLWDLSNASSSGIVGELGGLAFVRFELISRGLAIAVSTFLALLLWFKPPSSARSRYAHLPPSRAVYFLRQVCAALSEAHGIGLIHRDIKPGNVMVCERGGRHDVIKLLDFGLVQPVVDAGDDERLAHEGVIAGTPAYMSPEQASGKVLDVRSDIYGIGALAHFLLTGRPPFVRASAVATLAAHLCAAPTPPSSGDIELPADLEAIVLRCLAKSPDDRFADAPALEQALAACHCVQEWSEQQAATWWRAHRENDTHATSHRVVGPSAAYQSEPTI